MLAESRDQLEQLVGHAVPRVDRESGAHGGDLLHLVDEQQDGVQLGEVREELAQGRGQAGARVRRQPRREQLDERPAEPGRHRLGEAGLARPRRAEQHDRLRRRHPVAVGEFLLREREHDPALDDLLLALHAGQRVPQPRRQRPPAQLADQARVGRGLVHDLLVVDEPLPAEVAGVQQRLRPGDARWQQRAADPPLAPAHRDRHQQHPGTLALRPRDGHRHHLVPHHGDHGRLAGAGRGHHLRDREHRERLVGPSALVPHDDRLVQVVVVKVPQPPGRHRHHHLTARSPSSHGMAGPPPGQGGPSARCPGGSRSAGRVTRPAGLDRGGAPAA